MTKHGKKSVQKTWWPLVARLELSDNIIETQFYRLTSDNMKTHQQSLINKNCAKFEVLQVSMDVFIVILF